MALLLFRQVFLMVFLPSRLIKDLFSGKYSLICILIPHIYALHVEMEADALTTTHAEEKSASHFNEHLLLGLLTRNDRHFGLSYFYHLLLQSEVGVD